jgi:hypothetical protein
VSEAAGPEGTVETGASGQSAEEIAAIVLPVLTGLLRDYFQEHPEAGPDVRTVLSPGGSADARAMAETLTPRQDDIQRVLEAAQQAEAALATETGLAPEAQAAAQAAEFAMDTMGMVVARPISAICDGPLREALAEMAQELRDDPEQDPAELAELSDEEYELIHNELFGDLFDRPEK